MSLVDDLEYMRQRLGRNVVLPTPPACQALLEQAQSVGIPVGRLFVLSRPLIAGIRGSYDRWSGDVWCHYDGSDNKGARKVLQCLLTFFAYVKLQLPPPATVEQDWEQDNVALHEARTLAIAWGREDLFTASDLEESLAYNQKLYLRHVAAGVLAGNLHPSFARSAYLALLDMQRQYQWSDTQFEEALQGVRENDGEVNAAVLDFDRCLLRAYWLSTSTRKRKGEPSPFGQFTLPQTQRTARVLCSALEQVARHRAEHATLWVPLQVSDRTSISFFHMEREQDLALIIEQVNAWLLEDLLERYVWVRFSLYADIRWKESKSPSPHLYHMSVEYVDLTSQSDEVSVPIRRELWVLVPARKRTEIVEASWQRYIKGWLAIADLSIDDLYYGLQALWPWLQQ